MNAPQDTTADPRPIMGFGGASTVRASAARAHGLAIVGAAIPEQRARTGAAWEQRPADPPRRAAGAPGRPRIGVDVALEPQAAAELIEQLAGVLLELEAADPQGGVLEQVDAGLGSGFAGLAERLLALDRARRRAAARLELVK